VRRTAEDIGTLLSEVITLLAKEARQPHGEGALPRHATAGAEAGQPAKMDRSPAEFSKLERMGNKTILAMLAHNYGEVTPFS
jgi:hypothetical protein